MSLINDALKRASTTEPKKDAAPGAPLQPVEDQPRGSSPGVVPLVLCIVGVGALFVAGGFWLKAKSTQLGPIRTEDLTETPAAQSAASPVNPSASTLASDRARNDAPKNPVARAASTLEKVQDEGEEQPPASTTHQTASPVEPTSQRGATVGGISELSKTVPATASTAANSAHSGSIEPAHSESETPAEPKQPETATAPRFKLQAIYYRLRGPTVVINGKTVKSGQVVDGAKVVSIQRTSVEIEYKGKYQTITLP